MSEILVIRLYLPATLSDGHVADARAEWAVVDETGACVLAPGSGPLSQATPLAAGRRTVVLVPATRVLRTRAEVPIKGTNRIAQALPFALEDALAEDVEELHFAGGARFADGQVAAAVVRREHMAAWLAELAAAHITPQALFADSDGVLDVSGTSLLLLEHQQTVLRDPEGDPVVTEPEALDGLLELWLAQPRPASSDGVIPPRNLQVYDATTDGVPNDVWERLQNQVANLEVRRLPDGALLRLAAAIVTSPGLNLLQGDYARRTSMGSYWPRWRLAAALVAALAGSVLATAGVDTWRLKRESAALAADLQQAVNFTFPGTDAAGDVRALVDARLQAGGHPGGAASSRQFLETLRTVSAAVSKTGNATIESVNYRAGVMELQVRAPSADTLDSIRKLVSESGTLKAEIQSSNAAGDQIEGRIRITGNGA